MAGSGGTVVFVPDYSHLLVAGTSVNVSGLNPNTWYYYRVGAVAGAATSD